MLVVRRLEITPIGAVADERLVAAAQALAQAAQNGLAHLGIAPGFVEVAADNVAAVIDPHFLGLKLGIGALAARNEERHARLWIVEHDPVDLLGGALAHPQDVFEPALLEAGDGFGILIMPRSATTQTRPMAKRWRRRSITGMSVVTSVVLPGHISEHTGRPF